MSAKDSHMRDVMLLPKRRRSPRAIQTMVMFLKTVNMETVIHCNPLDPVKIMATSKTETGIPNNQGTP